MMRRVLKILGIVGLLLLLWTGAVWYLLRPLNALQVPAQQRLVFANVTVINPGQDRASGQVVTIDKGQIVALTSHSSAAEASETTQQFAGGYILPGLIDMHAHHLAVDQDLFGLLFLMHGVTTIRDIGYPDLSMLQNRQQIQDGVYAGPRFFVCGPILDGDPPWPHSWFRVIRSPDEGRAAVEDIAKAGVDCVKVYSGLTPETLSAVREAAARHHLPVVGHVPFAVPYEAAGIVDIQHLLGIPDVPSRLTATRASRAQQFPEFLAAWRHLDNARKDFVVRISVEQRLAHTPTVVVYARNTLLNDPRTLRIDPAVRLLPRWYRDALWQGFPTEFAFDSPQQFGEYAAAALGPMQDMVVRLYKAGVHIHTGSDDLNPFVVPGVSLHEELRLFVEAGLTPEEAWVTATRWPGEALGLPKLGTLQDGAPADFLIFRQDPTQDLAALSTLEAVVAQGRLYPKATLDAAFTRYRERFESWLYDLLITATARLLI